MPPSNGATSTHAPFDALYAALRHCSVARSYLGGFMVRVPPWFSPTALVGEAFGDRLELGDRVAGAECDGAQLVEHPAVPGQLLRAFQVVLAEQPLDINEVRGGFFEVHDLEGAV